MEEGDWADRSASNILKALVGTRLQDGGKRHIAEQLRWAYEQGAESVRQTIRCAIKAAPAPDTMFED